MPARTHSRARRSRKPYLMQWVLQQEAPRKQALLQVLTGVPDRECAHRLGLTLEQVQEIKLWFAKNSPSFAEEDYVMSYYSSHGIEEFCRETGQDEYVYWLMKLKYQRPNHTAGQDATASVDAMTRRLRYAERSAGLLASERGALGELRTRQKKRQHAGLHHLT